MGKALACQGLGGLLGIIPHPGIQSRYSLTTNGITGAAVPIEKPGRAA